MFGSRHGSWLAAAAVFGGLLCLAGREAKALYDVKPDEIPGKPGSIIRIWPLEGGGAGVVGKGNAFRVYVEDLGEREKRVYIRVEDFYTVIVPAPETGFIVTNCTS